VILRRDQLKSHYNKHHSNSSPQEWCFGVSTSENKRQKFLSFKPNSDDGEAQASTEVHEADVEEQDLLTGANNNVNDEVHVDRLNCTGEGIAEFDTEEPVIEEVINDEVNTETVDTVLEATDLFDVKEDQVDTEEVIEIFDQAEVVPEHVHSQIGEKSQVNRGG
jgi:hypothetical protein